MKLPDDGDPRPALKNGSFWALLSLAAEQEPGFGSAAATERIAGRLPMKQVAAGWIVTSDHGNAVDDCCRPCRLRPGHGPSPAPRRYSTARFPLRGGVASTGAYRRQWSRGLCQCSRGIGKNLVGDG